MSLAVRLLWARKRHVCTDLALPSGNSSQLRFLTEESFLQGIAVLTQETRKHGMR